MHETTTFELAVLGTVIALASMFSAWVVTGRSVGAWGTTIAAALVVLCAVSRHVNVGRPTAVEV